MDQGAFSGKTLHERLKLVVKETNEDRFQFELTNFNKQVENAENTYVVSCLGSVSIHETLHQLINRAVDCEISDVEPSEYTKDVFRGRAALSENVLESVLCLLKCISPEDAAVTRTLRKINPHVVHLASGNVVKNLWTSASSVLKATKVLQQLKTLYRVDAYSDLLQVSLTGTKHDLPSPADSLYGLYLAIVQHVLTRDSWRRNPVSVASFVWVLLHTKSPWLSEYLGQVLPLPLNMVDDFTVENKIVGVKCLYHILQNVSHEELRWYGRADVVYAALRHQLYTKNTTLMTVLHPALLLVLRIVERAATSASSREMSRHDEIFKMIIYDSEMENNIHLRRSLTAHIPAFIDVMGISVVCHMTSVVGLVSNYLEIYDGPEETSRLNALSILKSLLLTVWPRIPVHANVLLKCLLKFLYDVGADTTVTPQTVKDEMTKLATECLLLLTKTAPDIVEPGLLSVCDTDTPVFVRDIASKVCETFRHTCVG
ncbi:TELO2-interacting protein 2-like [Haliotis rufescens]|uniref:TELO2-interacting protein 2-like n=1 Tax=Haliotis rufescens TaxID=6454 RepID=UPI001EB091BB|nr:TELO2-interacting protein 2-like [Haliotis rufescens]